MSADTLNMKLEKLAPISNISSEIHVCNGENVVAGDCAEGIKYLASIENHKELHIKAEEKDFGTPLRWALLPVKDFMGRNVDDDDDFELLYSNIAYFKNKHNVFQAVFEVDQTVENLNDILKVWFNFCRKLGLQIHRVVQKKTVYLVYFSVLDNKLNLYQYTYVRAGFVRGYFTTVKLFYTIKKNMPELDDFRVFYLAQSINSFFDSYNPYYGFSNKSWKKGPKDGLYLLHADSLEIRTNCKFQTEKSLNLNTFEIKDTKTKELIYSNTLPTDKTVTEHLLPKCPLTHHPIVKQKQFVELKDLIKSESEEVITSVRIEENNFKFSRSISLFVERVLIENIWTNAETEFILNHL